MLHISCLLPILFGRAKKEGIAEEDAKQALKELEELAHCRDKLEEIAAEQLEAFGFKVHRYPGRYFMKRVGASKVEVMNMFNFLTVMVGQNERLVVALGTIESDVSYRAAFLRMLQETGGDPEHVEFLSLELSQMLLKHKGGLSCSIKTIE